MANRGFDMSTPSCPPDPDRLLREGEAAAFTGLAVRTLQDRRLTGEGPPYVKISRRCVRYRLSDIKAWVAAHVVAREA